MTNGQRNPVYRKMKDGVKAGGWEKLETSPPPPTPLYYIALMLKPKRQIEINGSVLDRTQELLHREMAGIYPSSSPGN